MLLAISLLLKIMYPAFPEKIQQKQKFLLDLSSQR